MNTPQTQLTEAQRELLSAWLDGEVTDAECATVEALLKNQEAAQYVEIMRATAALVATHAPVRAPVGLSGRVLNALESEFTPKAFAPGSEPFTAIPTLSWRAPLYAAAAAILVALGIMFGPALTSPTTPTDVSRTSLNNLPERTSEQPSPETVTEDARVLDALEQETTFREKDALSHDFERMSRRGESGEAWGKSEDASKPPELDAMRKELDGAAGKLTEEELKNSPDKHTPEPATGAADPKRSEAEKPGEPRDGVNNDNRGDSDGGGDGKSGKVGGVSGGDGAGRSSPSTKKGDPETRGDDSSGGSTGGIKIKDKLDEPKSPSRPAQAEADDTDDKEEGAKEAQDGPGAKDDTQAISIDISDAGSIAAQTDVLWVSSLYGDAELTEAETEVESVAVEIDADKLPELLAALRRLAKDQGYGEVDGGVGEEAKLADRARGQRISGYLPADEPEESPEGNEQAPPSPQPSESKQAEKVRIIIRLK